MDENSFIEQIHGVIQLFQTSLSKYYHLDSISNQWVLSAHLFTSFESKNGNVYFKFSPVVYYLDLEEYKPSLFNVPNKYIPNVLNNLHELALKTNHLDEYEQLVLEKIDSYLREFHQNILSYRSSLMTKLSYILTNSQFNQINKELQLVSLPTSHVTISFPLKIGKDFIIEILLKINLKTWNLTLPIISQLVSFIDNKTFLT